MADLYTYTESITPQENSKDQIFYNRQFTFLPDNNNGNYSSGSSILFQLESVASNGKFVDWGNSFLTIPLVLNANCVGPAAAAGFNFLVPGAYGGAGQPAAGNVPGSIENVFAMSLKNMPALFHSLQVSISNLECVQNASFSHLDIQYRLMSTMNQDSLKTLGPSLLFHPDSLGGYDVTNYFGNTGQAANQAIETNNAITETPFSPKLGFLQKPYINNSGRLERMKQTSFDAGQIYSVANPAGGLNAPSTTVFGKNYCQLDPGNNNITYFILAVVPLKVLHPLFESIPLCKGMVCKINLFLNTGCTYTSTITKGAANGNGVCEWTTTASQTVSPFGVLPFMVSPVSQSVNAAGIGVAVSRGLALSPAIADNAAVTFTATLGIAKSLPPQNYTHPTFSTCRLYFNTLEMSPSVEELYFSQYPSKTLLYEDRQASYIISGVGPSQSRNILIQNGCSRMRYLLVWPKISPGTAGAVYTAGGNAITLDPWLSPFTSSPSTPAPYGWLTNTNVIISGTNLYQEPFNASWQFFQTEVRQLKNVDGGLDLSQSCGLISQTDWEAAPFYVFNLARKIDQAADDISRSVQFSFTNSSNLTIDYHCLVCYERELTISTTTGTLIV